MDGKSDSTTTTLSQGAEKNQASKETPEAKLAPSAMECPEAKLKDGRYGQVQTLRRINRIKEVIAPNRSSKIVLDRKRRDILNSVRATSISCKNSRLIAILSETRNEVEIKTTTTK